MLLHRLLYFSRCTLASQGAQRRAEIRALAEEAAARNARRQLTGVLAAVGDSFVQALEGPAEAIEATFERICCDFRHSDMKLVDLTPVRERAFPGSGLTLLDAGEAGDLREDLEELRFLIGVNAREALDMMQRLAERASAAPA